MTCPSTLSKVLHPHRPLVVTGPSGEFPLCPGPFLHVPKLVLVLVETELTTSGRWRTEEHSNRSKRNKIVTPLTPSLSFVPAGVRQHTLRRVTPKVGPEAL